MIVEGTYVKLFTDNPITSDNEDQFGFAHYAYVLRDTILQTGPLPFCVGIFGNWGSGKTSFMKMIESSIANERKVRSIWFNPWKYDKKEDLWSALIQSIVYKISAKYHGQEENAQKAKHLALAMTWLAMKKVIAALTAGVISESNLDNLVDSFSEVDKKYHQYINNFEESFNDLVDDYTEGGKLVIFIDDLDRCLPENAITVLESLKLFIGHAQCIFVLGMDYYIVEEGIRSRYTDKVKLSGREYLDKIVQVPFYLPPVPYETIKASLIGGEVSHILSEEIWNIIHLGMDGNPRKTKRFVNCFNLLQSYLRTPTRNEILLGKNTPILSEAIQNIYLAKLLVFQMSFPGFYLHLRHHPEDWVYLEKSIIQEDNSDKRRFALREKPELETLWRENPNLQIFMRKTAMAVSYPHLKYPIAPSDEIVSKLLQDISLIAENPDRSA